MNDNNDKPEEEQSSQRKRVTVEELRGEEPPVEEEVVVPVHYSPFKVASGLIRADLFFLAPALLLLSLPNLGQIFIKELFSTELLLLSIGKRIIDLSFLYLIAERWIQKARGAELRFNLHSFGRVIGVGMFFWLGGELPVMAWNAQVSEAHQQLLLVTLVVATLMILRYYFYFFTMLLPGNNLMTGLMEARNYALRDRWIAVKAILVPFAIRLFIFGLILSAAPQGNGLFSNSLIALNEGLFWILSSYIGLGFAFALLPERRWEAEKEIEGGKAAEFSIGLGFIDRSDFLANLSDTSIKNLDRLIKPSNALLLIVLGAFLSLTAIARNMSAKPLVDIKIESVSVDERNFSLNLEVSAADGPLSSLKPMLFRVGDENGNLITKGKDDMPISVEVEGKAISRFSGLPDELGESAKVKVTFETVRSERGIRALKGVYLLHGAYKVTEIDFSKEKKR